MSVTLESLDRDIQSIAIKQAGIEMALWAAMRAIFETSPKAATFLREFGPSLLDSVSGSDAEAGKAIANTQFNRWLPKDGISSVPEPHSSSIGSALFTAIGRVQAIEIAVYGLISAAPNSQAIRSALRDALAVQAASLREDDIEETALGVEVAAGTMLR